MSYKVLVAETTEDLFGDNPYGSFLTFDAFESGKDALQFAEEMMTFDKAIAILPVGEKNE